MFLLSMNEAHPHPSRGEGHLVGYAIKEPAHIPHERGGADGGQNIPGGLKQLWKTMVVSGVVGWLKLV